ncbi:MAG: SAM-dependent methyltransferase [Rhodospirillaceae bacterium]
MSKARLLQPDLLTHYEQPGLLDRIEAGLQALGENPAQPSLEALAKVDEFHIRGLAATRELIARLDPKPGERILDVGCGLGGPARQLVAARPGVQMLGIDISRLYCRVAKTLTQRTGLGDRLSFRPIEIAALGATEPPFDAAWTLHVGMNIEDKAGFYGAIRDCLKPGGRILIYDLFSPAPDELCYPMPWADHRAQSFLTSPEALGRCLDGVGFQVIEQQDDTAKASAFLQKASQRRQANPERPPLGLHTLLGPRKAQILPNIAHGFGSENLRVISLLAHRLD